MAQRDDEEFVRKLFWAIGPDTTPPPGYEERLFRRLKARIQVQESNPSSEEGRDRPRMLAWALRIASAAAVAVVIAVAAWFLVGGGIGKASADFAEVLRRVCQASTVAYDEIFRMPGQPETKVRILLSVPGRTRVVLPDGKIMVLNYTEQKGLTLSSATKKAILVRLTAWPAMTRAASCRAATARPCRP